MVAQIADDAVDEQRKMVVLGVLLHYLLFGLSFAVLYEWDKAGNLGVYVLLVGVTTLVIFLVGLLGIMSAWRQAVAPFKAFYLLASFLVMQLEICFLVGSVYLMIECEMRDNDDEITICKRWPLMLSIGRYFFGAVLYSRVVHTARNLRKNLANLNSDHALSNL